MEIQKEKKEFRDYFAKDKQKNISIIEYVQKEMRTFAKKPFCEVDSLILSQLSYMHVGKIVSPSQDNAPSVRIADFFKAELFDEILDDVRDSKSNKELLFALCASPRYRDIKANYFINKVDEEQEKQFSAITFFLPTNMVYIAFRGTDATVVGWKEDFNMTFISPVPSQLSAMDYLVETAGKTHSRLYVGGHSKGGNLAVYSALYAPKAVQDRIETIFSHDGPGLLESELEKAEYKYIQPKINITLPKSSLIGMMFDNRDYKVVLSNRMGVMQHDPFSWEISGDNFAYTEKVTDSSLFMNQTLNSWIESLSADQRRIFVDTLFSILEATSAKSFSEWPQTALKEGDRIIKAVSDIDDDTVKCLTMIVSEFIKISLKNIIKPTDKALRETSLAEDKSLAATEV